MDRLTQIRDIIDRANYAYYITGKAFLNDATYDALKVELKVLAPDDPRHAQVGAPSVRDAIREKRMHAIPMGSQDKAHTKEELLAFIAKRGLPPETVYHTNLKMDGGSLSFEYVHGSLYRVITRGGDGVEGDDITANALLFANTPKRVLFGGEPFTGHVRAEVLLSVESWKLLDPELESNPRNLAVGIAGRLDGSDAEHLRIVAFRAYDSQGNEVDSTESGMESALKEMGFDTSRSMVGTVDAVLAFYEVIRAERNTLPFWIDGLVIKLDSIPHQLRLGVSSGCPNGQIALKFPPEGKPSVIRSVEITVGHTGAIIPTAKFDQVILGGTKVASATLHNWDEIAALDVAIGDTVLIEKMGDIIPAISSVIDRPSCRQVIDKPAVCPCCGGPLNHRTTVAGDESAHLYCDNEQCSSRVLGKIKRWVKSLRILGIGEENVAALVSDLNIRDAADLYRLRDDLPRLSAMEVSAGIRFGEKRAVKLLAEIEGKREISIDFFFGSLGVDGLGVQRVKVIRAKVPGQMDTVEDWMNGKLATIAAAAGVPKVAARLVTELGKKRELVDRLLAAGVIVKADAPSAPAVVNPGAKSFCITGSLSMPKGHFQGLITGKGHVYKDSVAKGLDYLVMADPGSASAKAKKARDLGVQCIGEAELIALVS